MAGAPYKKGLNYFSHDTVLSNDIKIEYLEAETGLIGYAIYLKLLELIYRDEGYYIKFDHKHKKLFAKRVNIVLEKLDKIIDVCLEEDLFNQNLFNKYNILTSKSIQKRYLRGCDRRNSINVIKEFFLLDNNSINDNSNPNNVNIYSITEGIN